MELSRKLFLALAGMLVGVGLLMVYSSSVTSRPTEFEWIHLRRHAVAALVGLVASLAAATRPAEFWKRTAPGWFGVTVLLLVLVLAPGIGTRVKGAQRWMRIAGVSLQPSELAKIALPLMTCLLLTARSTRLTGWWSGTAPILFPTLLIVPLVLIEPDLGTAAFLALGTLIALWVGGWPMRNFVIGLVCLSPAALGVFWLKPYQQQRLIGFVEAWNHFEAAPYQIRQSLVTLGAGGWLGEGLGRGFQKLSFLPEANTDFVFAVVGEELGLVGTLSLVAAWCGLYLSGIRLLSKLDPRSFSFQAGCTLLTLLVAQALFNVAVVTAMVPPKGIAHPLISVGGSNLVVSLTLLGVVVSLLGGEPKPANRDSERLDS